MVLQIAADAGKLAHRRDVEAAQIFAAADSGKHQQLRRLESAGADDYFRSCGDRPQLLADLVLYAGRALAGEQDPPRTRAGDHLQIRSVQMRMDVGARRAAALAVLLRDLKGAKAFLALAVEIVGRRQLQLAAGVEKALLEWIR